MKYSALMFVAGLSFGIALWIVPGSNPVLHGLWAAGCFLLGIVAAIAIYAYYF